VESRQIADLAGQVLARKNMTVAGLGPLEKAEIDWNV
jgi:hypothetical protein